MDAMTSDAILHRAAELFAVTTKDLTGPRRTPDLLHARFAAAYALRRYCQDMTLCAIGRALGGRDHSTIINALRRAEVLAQRDTDYAAKLRALVGGPSVPIARHPPVAVYGDNFDRCLSDRGMCDGLAAE
jgi:chromosomal replication initiator protein